MTLRVDPEKNEVRALKDMTDWHGKHVIEIGCGNGRLTRRLARLGANVSALDPNKALITTALRELPVSFSDRVQYKVGSTENLKYSDKAFDIAVFSWVL